MRFKDYLNDKEIDEKFRINYPYLANLVDRGKLDGRIDFVNTNLKDIIDYTYIMINESLWDTVHIKAGDVGGKSFYFFTQNNINSGISYFSNSCGNEQLPLTTHFLLYKITAAIEIVCKSDLKFKIDISDRKNGVSEITVPFALQDIIDKILYHSSLQFEYLNTRMIDVPLSQIAVIKNLPVIETIDGNIITKFYYGLQEDQIKEFDKYILMWGGTNFRIRLKFGYDVVLPEDISIKVKMHGNKFMSIS